MTTHTPLDGPEDFAVRPASVDAELRLARHYLGEIASANIHDHTEMITAATGLHYRLHALVAAIDAERGEAT